MGVSKTTPTGVTFFQSIGSNGRAHRSVEDENTFGEGGLEFFGKIVRHGLALRAEFWSDLGGSQEQIYASRYVDGFAFRGRRSQFKKIKMAAGKEAWSLEDLVDFEVAVHQSTEIGPEVGREVVLLTPKKTCSTTVIFSDSQ